MKSFALTILAVLLPFVALVGGAAGDGDRHVKAFLNGYQEVVGPGSISTIGEGRFKGKIDRDAQTITYELRYTLENTATASHIHFAQRHVAGGVIAFLCGRGTQPASRPGTAPEGVARSRAITPLLLALSADVYSFVSSSIGRPCTRGMRARIFEIVWIFTSAAHCESTVPFVSVDWLGSSKPLRSIARFVT